MQGVAQGQAGQLPFLPDDSRQPRNTQANIAYAIPLEHQHHLPERTIVGSSSSQSSSCMGSEGSPSTSSMPTSPPPLNLYNRHFSRRTHRNFIIGNIVLIILRFAEDVLLKNPHQDPLSMVAAGLAKPMEAAEPSTVARARFLQIARIAVEGTSSASW